MVEKYLKALLFEQDFVVLPGFGGFIAQHAGADIHPITNKFLPPSKKIAFNEQLKNDDGVLISTISREEQLEKDQATALVKGYVDLVQEELKKFNRYFLDGVGKFFYNSENQLEFEPDNETNFLEDSFGLTELLFKPIERTFTDMNKIQPRVIRPIVKKRPPVKKEENSDNSDASYLGEEEDEKPKKRMSPVVILPLVLLVGLIGLVFYVNKGGKGLATMMPMEKVDTGGSSNPSESPEIAFSEESAPELTSSELESSTGINSAKKNSSSDPAFEAGISGKFYVVVGAFEVPSNAKKLKRRIQKDGGDPSIIQPDHKNRFYKVSVAEFDAIDPAVSKMEELRSTYGNTIWVFAQ